MAKSSPPYVHPVYLWVVAFLFAGMAAGSWRGQNFDDVTSTPDRWHRGMAIFLAILAVAFLVAAIAIAIRSLKTRIR